MMAAEGSGNRLPDDEIAPNLGLIWTPDTAERAHYSSLEPDPEAQVDMRTWARMFFQMKALDKWEEIYAYAQLPDQEITVEFPVYGSYNADGPCTSMLCGFDQFITDGTEIAGRRGLTLECDIQRPGYIKVHEAIVAQPDKIESDERLSGCTPLEEAKEGTYMTKDGKDVGYRFATYVLDQAQLKLFVIY